MNFFYYKIPLYWRCQLIGWALYAIIPPIYFLLPFVLETHTHINVSVYIMYLLESITVISCGIIISHAMKMVIKKTGILEKSFQSQVLYFFLLTAFFSTIFLVWTNLIILVWTLIIDGSDFFKASKFFNRHEFFQAKIFQAIIFSGTFIIWNLIYFLYNYLKKIRKEERGKVQMRIQILELEAHALRAQMNPHFIFNCMNSIKSLMQENKVDKGITYLTTFSKLIRTLFTNADKKEITLHDEIETCKLYLQLEAMRFDAKFAYHIDIDETIDMKSISVPALIVQPFIENAIWHGIVPKGNDGSVLLEVSKQNGNIEIIIDDNGIGRESSQQNKGASSIGHQSKGVNLSQSRLELDNLLQQRQANLKTIDKKDDQGKASGTRVIITLPQEE